MTKKTSDFTHWLEIEGRYCTLWLIHVRRCVIKGISSLVPSDIAPAPSTSAAQAEEIASAPSTSAAQAEEIAPATLPHRKRARKGIVQQAERMIKRSRLEHAPGNPGDNVTVPIPLVDRGRGDPRNIMGVIIDRDNNDLYRIAVRGGMLQG